MLEADSTYGWNGLWDVVCEPPSFMRWTSGSLGSSVGGEAAKGASSLTGLERFGSSLALIAFRMRIAWYFANLVFEVTSESGSFFHMVSMSRKVEAARKVSAVPLCRTVSIPP